VLRAEAAAIDASLLQATEGSSRQRTHDLHQSLQEIDALGGSQGFYGAAMARELRERIETSAEGQTLLLSVLRAAHASLTGDEPLPAPLCIVFDHRDPGQCTDIVSASLQVYPPGTQLVWTRRRDWRRGDGRGLVCRSYPLTATPAGAP
jgi:hypothetical protein